MFWEWMLFYAVLLVLTGAIGCAIGFLWGARTARAVDTVMVESLADMIDGPTVPRPGFNDYWKAPGAEGYEQPDPFLVAELPVPRICPDCGSEWISQCPYSDKARWLMPKDCKRSIVLGNKAITPTEDKDERDPLSKRKRG